LLRSLGPLTPLAALLALTSGLGASACTAELLAPSEHSDGAASGGQSGGGTHGTTDLPCEVDALLRQYCQGCHSAATTLPLVSHADLVAPSGNPALSMAQAGLERLQATDDSRMPPAPASLPPQVELDAFAAWVVAGAKAGSCSDELPPPATDPYDTPVVCTSGTRWTGGDRESPNMHPGRACISCHAEEGEGPELEVAGTIYPTAHEPDDCNGVSQSSGAYVVIVDAAGRVFELQPETSGNFMLEDPDAFSPPYSAKVVSGGGERVMMTKLDNGDCNECHTEGGTSNAPGRIMAP
jgi:hypothetical protein